MQTVGDEIREFINELVQLAHRARCFSVISPIIANCVDHLSLRATLSDRLQTEPRSGGEAP